MKINLEKERSLGDVVMTARVWVMLFSVGLAVCVSILQSPFKGLEFLRMSRQATQAKSEDLSQSKIEEGTQCQDLKSLLAHLTPNPFSLQPLPCSQILTWRNVSWVQSQNLMEIFETRSASPLWLILFFSLPSPRLFSTVVSVKKLAPSMPSLKLKTQNIRPRPERNCFTVSSFKVLLSLFVSHSPNALYLISLP